MTHCPISAFLTGRTAWSLWLTLLIVDAVLILTGSERTVTPVYRDAAVAWFAGNALYDGSGWGFIYLPSASILWAPFAWLPEPWGDILWRTVTIGSYGWGIHALARLARPDGAPPLFPLMTLITLPLAWDSARNGQMTLPVTALLVAAAVGLAEQRWWRSAVWLSLGLALKPVVLTAILLAGALYRPMAWRLTLGVAGIMLFPFLFQSADYVTTQYRDFADTLAVIVGTETQYYYAHLFGMLRVVGIEFSEELRLGLRAIAAVFILGLCLRAQRCRSDPQAAIFLYALAACYIMLFSARNEFNTYSLLAPAIAVFCARALFVEQHNGKALALALAALGILLNYEVGKWLVSSPEKAVWLAPLMGTAFLLFLVLELRRPTWVVQQDPHPDAPDKH